MSLPIQPNGSLLILTRVLVGLFFLISWLCAIKSDCPLYGDRGFDREGYLRMQTDTSRMEDE